MPKQSATTTRSRSRRRATTTTESDSTYLLKLVAFVLLGTLWLRFDAPLGWGMFTLNGLPIGLLIGLPLVHHFEKNQEDRKIWYACLIIVTIVCAFAPVGIFV